MATQITLRIRDSLVSSVIAALIEKYSGDTEEMTDQQIAKKVIENYIQKTTLKYIRKQAANRLNISDVTE